MIKKIKIYLDLIRFNKPIGILLLWWTTLSALFLNVKNIPSIKNMIIFAVGVFITRSLGCAINDMADRNYDKFIMRTKNRPITKGYISLFEFICLIFFILILSLFTVMQLDLNSILFSPFILIVIIIYPFFKRFFDIPQLILGFAFSLSIILIYISTKKILDISSFYLFIGTIIWALIYDTQYAMVDKKDDLTINLKSSAIYFGNYNKQIIGILQVLHIIIYTYIYLLINLYFYLFFLLIISSLLIIYQQYLIKTYNTKNFFRAFLNNNYYGFFINIPISIHYIL